MCMPASELNERMTGEEFAEHYADYCLAPWGEERDDVRAAAIMEVAARSQGGKLTRKEAYDTLSMDKAKSEPVKMSEDAMKAALRMLG